MTDLAVRSVARLERDGHPVRLPRHLHRLLRHLPGAAHHQGHPRGADGHRHRAHRRGVLRRRALRADHGVVAARQLHRVLHHPGHRRVPAGHPPRAHPHRAERVAVRQDPRDPPRPRRGGRRRRAPGQGAHRRHRRVRARRAARRVPRPRRAARRPGVQGAAGHPVRAVARQRAARRRGHHRKTCASTAPARSCRCRARRWRPTSAPATAPRSASPRRPTRSSVVVSEERGEISLCFRGNIARDLETDDPAPRAARPVLQRRARRDRARPRGPGGRGHRQGGRGAGRGQAGDRADRARRRGVDHDVDAAAAPPLSETRRAATSRAAEEPGGG